jgi:hypothetical protein
VISFITVVPDGFGFCCADAAATDATTIIGTAVIQLFMHTSRHTDERQGSFVARAETTDLGTETTDLGTETTDLGTETTDLETEQRR